MFAEWFQWRSSDLPLAPVIYDPLLVGISVLIACLGGIAAVQLIGLARRPERFGRPLALAAHVLAVLAMGVSVWSMHFIGMLAADICQPVRFNPSITALSMLPSLLASAVGLRLYMRHGGGERLSLKAIVGAGFWVGAGIGAMHYTGMAAMEMDSLLRYDPLWFVLSVLVAVTLASAGLGVREVLRRYTQWPPLAVLLVAGSLLGLATSGMHYTAMHASLFIGPVDLNYPRWSDRQFELALSVALTTVAVFGFAWGLLGIASYRVLLVRLREREALLSDIMDNMPDAVVRLRAGGSFERLLVSKSLVRITGLSVAGYERGDWTLLDLIHPDDLPDVHRTIKQALAEGQSPRFEARLRHITQGWKWVAIRGVASRSEKHSSQSAEVLDLYLSDVTAEREARERERALLAAIDQVVGRAVLTPQGTFLEVNQKLAATLGYTPQELVGRPHRMVWTDDIRQADMDRFWEALRAGQPQPGDFQRRTKDGQIRHLSGWYQPLFDNTGQVHAVLKLAFDVTERVETVKALQVVQRELEQALASRSAFFANVSHEIRTPMNAIVGFAELLRERLPTGADREQAQAILDSARGLLRILNDLLDAAKLERGEFTIDEQAFFLDRLLNELVSQFGMMASAKQVDMRLDMPPGLPRCWMGDGDRIKQILINLLGNAVKFTAAGQIVLGARSEPGALHLWVEDTGIGIPKERQASIFDPFVQADAGTARRYGGTGLGMSIVKRLAELMGGQVRLSSEVGKGTRVDVRLPLQALPEDDCRAAHQEATPDAADPPAAMRRLRLLAADDVAQNRQLLAAVLERAGHEHAIFADGAELLQAYQADPGRWDAVLLDLHMPGLDGWTTCERLRAFERERQLPAIPVYALTASVLEDDRHSAQRAQMNGFLEKPIQLAALERALREAGQIRHASAPPAGGASVRPALSGHAVVNPSLAQDLWGERWWTQLQPWVHQVTAQRHEWSTWGRQAWHSVAGVAANMALPEVAQCARACEDACRQGQPADVAGFAAAWERLLIWMRQHPDGPAHSPPDAAPLATPPSQVADWATQASHLQALRQACALGEWSEAHLQALLAIDAAAYSPLKALLDGFDFEAAATWIDQRLTQAPAP